MRRHNLLTGFALSLVISVSATTFSGCAGMNRAQTGALVGTGFGAIVGSAIGGHNGHPGGGALIGAATGALAGGLIGDAEDARDERDFAISQAHYAQQAQQALTNNDLVAMSQSGVGEDVIIGMIQSRGGRFNLSPNDVIMLKSSGVSDRVLIAAQSSPQFSTAQPPVIVRPAPIHTEVVFAPYPPPPPPGLFIEFGPRRSHWHRHHHCD